MRVNLDACIHCTLCVRACREVQVNDVIGMAGRGHDAKIVFDQDDPMGSSTCVACGECVQACPTGALMPASIMDTAGIGDRSADRAVKSVCPFCGVGCQLTFHVKDEKIAYVTGAAGPANENRLCVKGRFGFDYVHHPERLTVPLIRKDGVAKSVDAVIDPANPWTHFREASWEEALARATDGLRAIRDAHGGNALAGFGSAKCSNEEAYLFQKLIRTGLHTNNVDHCTRLCHASSVAALMEGIGSGAVTAPFSEVKNSDVIVVIGANPTENHPVAATYLQAGGQARCEAHRHGPARPGAEAPRHPHAAVLARPRRGAPERHAQRDRHRGAVRPPVHPGPHHRLRAAQGTPRRLSARGHGADLRRRRRDHPRGGPPLRPRRGGHRLLGHGRLAAHPRHRQLPRA